MDLAELQRAALRNAQATQQMQGLDEQYVDATGRRDAQMGQMDRYGQVSPLAIMAQMIGKSRGRKDTRELAPQREALRTQMGTNEGAIQGQSLKQAMEKHAQDQEIGKSNLLTQSLSRKKTERDMSAGQGAKRWTSMDGKQVIPVVDLNGIPFTQNPQSGAWDIPVDATKFVPEERFSGGSSGSSGGKHMTPNQLGEFTDAGNQIRKVSGVVGNFRPEYSQIADLPTESLNRLLTTSSTADLLKYAQNPELDETSKAAAMWWADWKTTYELIERHKLFGATLTNNEMGSWREAVHTLQGMDPNAVQARIDKLLGDLQGDLGNRANAQVMLSSGRPNEVAALNEILTNAGAHKGEDERYQWGEPKKEPPTQEELMAVMSVEDRAEFISAPPEEQKAMMEFLLQEMSQ